MRLFAALAIASLLVGSVGWAQEKKEEKKLEPFKFGLNLRADYSSSNSKVGDAPATIEQKFVINAARVIFQGDVDDKMSYFVRLNAKGGHDETAVDGSVESLERAYVDYKPMGMLTMRVGKYKVLTGSVERVLYDSMDYYHKSYLRTYVDGLVGNGTGVEMTGNFGDHKVLLQVANGLPVDADEGETQGKPKGENNTLSVIYRGDIAKMVKPVVSYSKINRIRNGSGAARDEKASYTAYGLGAQIAAAGAVIDLEYDIFQTPEFKTFEMNETTNAIVETTNAKNDIKSMVFGVGYDIKAVKVKPLLKYSTDEHKVDSEKAKSQTATTLAVEWRPGEKNVRYHAAYVMKDDTKVVTGKDDVKTKTTTVLVGTAITL
jgi:Phosphate-selective porin O and P